MEDIKIAFTKREINAWFKKNQKEVDKSHGIKRTRSEYREMWKQYNPKTKMEG